MHPVVSNERDSSDAIKIEVHRAWPNSGSKTRSFEAKKRLGLARLFPFPLHGTLARHQHRNIGEKMG